MACEVKANLSRQVSLLEKYVHWYEIAGTAIIPLFAMYSFWYLIPKVRFMNGRPGLNNYSLIWIVGTILLTILFYFLNRWYVNKLYGKHIKKLKLMLEQMDDQ